MKNKVQVASRLIFALVFIIFGLNGFFHFIPVPQVTPQAGALLEAFATTDYFLPMIKTIEVLVGVLLIFNLFAPFAIVLITPILVGITTIHLFLNPAGLPIMILLHVLHAILAYSYRPYYQGLLTKKA